jgi:hypothetical protein
LLLAKRLIRSHRNKAASGRDLPSSYSLPIASSCKLQAPVESAQGGGGKYSPSEGLSSPPPQDTEIQIYTREGPPPASAPDSARGGSGRTSPAIPSPPPTKHEGLGEDVGAYSDTPLQDAPLAIGKSPSLRARYQRILAWFNQKRPMDSLTPYERRLAYRQIEHLVRDPAFEPPPSGFRPPTFEEALSMAGVEVKG